MGKASFFPSKKWSTYKQITELQQKITKKLAEASIYNKQYLCNFHSQAVVLWLQPF